jgi:hypothetical protein
MVPTGRKGDFNFVWLFAVVAGTAILILAVYGAVKYGKTTAITQDTEIAKALSVVTDSMQAGFASGRSSTIRFKKDTLIENYCFEGNFGTNEISVMTKERPNEDFESFGVPIKVDNKYLFVSDKPGKEFFVFSVPIDFAFKIADAIIIDSQEYCFIGLEGEENIERTLSVLGKKAKFGVANCTDDSVKVCFGSLGDCEIIVYPGCNNPSVCESEYDVGRVESDRFSVEYVGNLLYPAIFSERESYLCNVKRLMYRQSILANMYSQKVTLMSSRNCNVDLARELGYFEVESFDLSNNLIDGELSTLYFEALYLKDKEKRGQCSLWS